MTPLQLTFGSDPELVIVDAKGTPCSALRILKTTKEKPIDLGESIRIYADNVLVEAAFDPVGPEGIVERIKQVLSRMRESVRLIGAGDYEIMPQAATHYPLRELRNRIAWQTGCNPNLDAYKKREDGMQNAPAKFENAMRTGSFHIHVGREDWVTAKDDRLMRLDSKIEAIKLLDMYLGLASVVFDKDPTAGLRRKLYGKAGEFRKTPYGIEYRVLGNYALRSEAVTKLVFDLVDIAMSHISGGTGQDALNRMNAGETIRIINNNDRASAIDAILNLGLDKEMIERIMSPSYFTEHGMKLGWGF